MLIRESGRSTDFISPSFGWGCLYDCSYCYMKRNKPEGLSVATNTEEILSAINTHAAWLEPKEPNQCDSQYWTYDISCNEDFALHAKHHDWEKIFQFFKDHETIKASFATKYVSERLLKFNPEGKVRIRFSLMPEHLRQMHEPETSSIKKRIKAIDRFLEAGYEVHVNFSPIIVYDKWINDYRSLMIELDQGISDKAKAQLKCECIFLTHNEKKHEANLKAGVEGEWMLWIPGNQEPKKSQYGGDNVRYRRDLKNYYAKQFAFLIDEVIPYCEVRYIF